jgi:chromosome segregation protein
LRLTHLKLAGFKSFVDATTLHIHGQRVGVVGPNGCGKSNVMESVRWVLGESSAKEMRADAMDAVIFNGSGNRKPISRASVELIFDNSMGAAAGEWSQYAEISVKRVIERDKGSTYYINNTVVRRRDVADLFLGTGLGGRAYAIIGQNTINRIVEAKPEELRVFLEEAAGISKYKERRRETELRLRDTRENLVRVQDILRELDKQIVRLQSQAAVAAQYHALQENLKLTKGQIALLKKLEASERWEAAQRLVEKLVNDLEAQMASLRHSESAVETARQTHFATSDAMQQLQAKYYEANAEVSNLENQAKSVHDAQERMKQQQFQLQQQIEKNQAQRAEVDSSIQRTHDEQQTVTSDFTQNEEAITQARSLQQSHSQTFQKVLAIFNANQAAYVNAEQRLRIEQTNQQHIRKSLAEIQAQLTRLSQQAMQLKLPDQVEITEKESQLSAAENALASIEEKFQVLQRDEQALETQIKSAREAHLSQQKMLHQAEAHYASLQKMQQSINAGNQEQAMNHWLQDAKLNEKNRLWQTIRIQAGWETALEAALGDKLNAILQGDTALVNKRPPVALTVVKPTEEALLHRATNVSGKPLLRDKIEKIAPNIASAVTDWLSGVYVLEANEDAQTLTQSLAQGEVLVNQEGDIFTKHSVTYFGPQTMLHGVLERQAEIDRLETEIPQLKIQVGNAFTALQQYETAQQELRVSQKSMQEQLRNATQQMHQQKLQLQQLLQQQQNVLARQSALESETEIAKQKSASLELESENQQQKLRSISEEISRLSTEKSASELEKNQAERALHIARQQLQSLERANQEKNFNIKLLESKLTELKARLQHLDEEKSHLLTREVDLQAQLSTHHLDELKQKLAAALNVKQDAEAALTSAREAQNTAETALQNLERERMKNEQLLHPLRDKLEASRLTEQETRLHFEQCQVDLASTGLGESALTESLQLNHEDFNRASKLKSLENARTKLTQEIDALGAVNLAAIQELASEEARRDLMNMQSNDLIEASETLENAIKKIDKETRGRLQATFDEANLHFKSLFATLFGGGEARLELLGDEILDTGMQVFAQPPGKKNSTIHLLSGGEKALTAIALVFALFRLNPAPFCLMDEVDAPLDDTNTERFCNLVKKMSDKTQFLFVSHNKITMEMAQQLIGVTMQESGVSRIVDVDMEQALRMTENASV